jgi:argininosuccinate lyase
VGEIVRSSIAGGTPMADLVRDHPDLGPEAVALLAPGVSVTRRTTPGGAGPTAVVAQLDRFRAQLSADRTRLATT